MQPTAWHLAEVNIARARAPLDSPLLADFVAALAEINSLADRAPGFVWRLTSESGDATSIRIDEDPQLLVNMSVWTGVEPLFDFVYKTAHAAVMARRREWFERSSEAYQALWWIPSGHVPSTEEALERLAALRANGPAPEAFTFKHRFPPPGGAGNPGGLHSEPFCSGWS
jgi:hypothetical protein